MQERELDYYNRKRFIEELRTMRLHSFGDVDPYINIMGDPNANCRNRTTFHLLHDDFVNMLDEIITGIYENTLCNVPIKYFYPTGHYFTDWFSIVLHKAFSHRFYDDAILTISKHDIGGFSFYTKNMQVLVFEKIIDRAIAVWNFARENRRPFSQDTQVQYCALIIETLDWIDHLYFSEYKIVNPNDDVYIYKNNCPKMIHVSEDGFMAISKKSEDISDTPFCKKVGLPAADLSDIIDSPSNLIKFAAFANAYKLIYNSLSDKYDWIMHAAKVATYDKDYVKITARLLYDSLDREDKVRCIPVLLKHHKEELESIAIERLLEWADESTFDSTGVSVGKILRANKEHISINIDTAPTYYVITLELKDFGGSSALYFARRYAGVGDIDFRRETGNNNKKTFDFVSVTFNIVNVESKEELIKFTKKYMRRLTARAIDAIRRSRSFSKYGISVNYLHLHDVVVTCTSTIVFMFELKQLISETTKEE